MPAPHNFPSVIDAMRPEPPSDRPHSLVLANDEGDIFRVSVTAWHLFQPKDGCTRRRPFRRVASAGRTKVHFGQHHCRWPKTRRSGTGPEEDYFATTHTSSVARATAEAARTSRMRISGRDHRGLRWQGHCESLCGSRNARVLCHYDRFPLDLRPVRGQDLRRQDRRPRIPDVGCRPWEEDRCRCTRRETLRNVEHVRGWCYRNLVAAEEGDTFYKASMHCPTREPVA